MADGDLCTLAQVKTYLGQTTTNADAVLAQLITQASDYVVAALGAPVVADDYDERFDGTGQSVVTLRYPPIRTVLRVEDGCDVIPRSAGPNLPGWFLDGRHLRLRHRRFTSGAAGVRVRYQAGYDSDDVPASLQAVVVEAVALTFQQRAHLDVASKTLAGETISYLQAALRARGQSTIDLLEEKVPA